MEAIAREILEMHGNRWPGDPQFTVIDAEMVVDDPEQDASRVPVNFHSISLDTQDGRGEAASVGGIGKVDAAMLAEEGEGVGYAVAGRPHPDIEGIEGVTRRHKDGHAVANPHACPEDIVGAIELEAGKIAGPAALEQAVPAYLDRRSAADARPPALAFDEPGERRQAGFYRRGDVHPPSLPGCGIRTCRNG